MWPPATLAVSTLLASTPALVLLQVGIGLAVILGGLMFLTRRLHGPRAGAGKVIRLTAQDAVHLVEVDGRRLLVGTGVGGPPRLICELADLEPAGHVGSELEGARARGT